jgi:hypothetical protein
MIIFEVLEYVLPDVMGGPVPPEKSHGLYDSKELAETKVDDLAKQLPHPIRATHIMPREVHVTAPPPWWTDHRNITLTAEFMNAQGHSVEEIIYMAEKPWKHNDDYNLAQAEIDLPNDLMGGS